MRKTITLEELIKKYRLEPTDSKGIADRIGKLQNDGFITPVKNYHQDSILRRKRAKSLIHLCGV